MVELSSRVLRDYIKYRLTSPAIPGYSQLLVNVETLGDNVVTLSTPMYRRKNTVEYSVLFEKCDRMGKIEIVIHPHCPGVNDRDVTYFLEQYPRYKIFEDGQPLCPRTVNLRRGIEKAKRFLRNNDVPSENKMVCYFERKGLNDEEVRVMIYDYMVRRGLYYLFHAGGFTPIQSK